MSRNISRRGFLKGTCAVAGASLLPWPTRRVAAGDANSKLQVAAVGVGGMMGFVTVEAVAGDPMVDVVAICDVDENFLNHAGGRFPKARKYADWREMLTKEQGAIDAVVVAIPDHMHASVALSAIRMGKHVYCQKPMAHDVFEVRQMNLAAQKAGVVTQLGNQHASGVGDRMTVQMIREGVIGKVKEVYMWSNRHGIEEFRFPGPRPAKTDPVPKNFNWDLWLGTAPERPFTNGVYHPHRWRGWQDFGTGWQGDLGCHIGSAVFLALGLTAPTSVRSEAEPAWLDNPARHAEVWPLWQVVTYEFPGTPFTAGNTVKATWLDGGKWPSDEIHALFENHSWPEECALFIGENGHLMLPHGDGPQLFPSEKYKTIKRPKLAGIDHYNAWSAAARTGDRLKPISNFDFAGPLTEAVLLGTVASRCAGRTLQWDTAGLTISNDAAANQLLRRKYRAGWEIAGL